MNFNSLSSNEKLGLYGAVAVIVGMLIASSGLFGFGLGTLALLAAIAMLVVIFLPQMSEGSSLPGSKGTLMLACGIIAAAVLVITLIQILPVIGFYLGTIGGIFFLIALVGSLAMAWAGWQELQGEGGSVRFGSGTSTPGGPPRSDASAPPAAPRPTSSAPPPASSWSDTSQPAAGSGGGSAAGGSEGAPSSGSGYGAGSSSGMGSTGSAPSSGGSDMGSEGGATSRRDDEGPPRNP